MPEQRGMGKGQCIHAITGTGGLRDIGILVLDLRIRWRRRWSHHTQPIYLLEKDQVWILEISRAPGPV
jgi:hypothetical protein